MDNYRANRWWRLLNLFAVVCLSGCQKSISNIDISLNDSVKPSTLSDFSFSSSECDSGKSLTSSTLDCSSSVNSSDDLIIIDNPISYYDDHLSSKIYTINKIKEQNNISYSFAFLTDLHWQSNIKKSPLLLKEIEKEYHLDKVVLGGDYIDYDFEDDSIPRRIMKECVDNFSDFDYTAIVGNHDSNNNSYQGTPRIPDAEIFSIINNVDSEYPYSIEYNENNKICSLYLNSSIDAFDDEKQKQFVYDNLVKLNEDWSVLFFIHIIFDGSYGNNNLSVIKPAGIMFTNFMDSILPDIKCNIIGVFSGHSHLDNLNTKDFSFPYITTMCDAFYSYNPKYNIYKREINTFTEQAFDVVQVDTKARKVFLTRIGAGSDRIFEY